MIDSPVNVTIRFNSSLMVEMFSVTEFDTSCMLIVSSIGHYFEIILNSILRDIGSKETSYILFFCTRSENE